MKKIGIVGFFAKQKPLRDGQTVKTQQLSKALKERLGEDEIVEVDMQGCRNRPFGFVKEVASICRNCENVVILPAHNALLFLPFLCLLFRKKGVRLFYDVIGGWLPTYIKEHSIVEKQIKKFDGIWVETSVMQKSLQSLGFDNVAILPNFKDLNILQESETHNIAGKPIKLCVFSRVTEVKGIDDAVNSVKKINEEMGTPTYSLDIYGPIDDTYADHFADLQKGFTDEVRYCGCVSPEKSTEYLKLYDALLFPTRYEGEGHPGTIIDAYSAGLPVLSAKWHSYSDFVDEGKTGLGYEQYNYDALCELLRKVASDYQVLDGMRVNCLKKAAKYSAKEVVDNLLPMFCK